MRSTILLVLLAALSLVGYAQDPQTTINVQVNGSQTRPALLYLPDDYSSTTTNYPLIVFLHGAGEAGNNLANIYNHAGAGGPAYFIAHSQWPTAGFVNPADAQTYKFIVVSPQASSNSFSASELNFILSDLIADYRVNINRVYLMGISFGGEGVVKYVGRDGVTPTNLAAAFVPLSAVINSSLINTTAANINNDNIRAWGFGSTTGCDIHGILTRDLMNAMNNHTAGRARMTEMGTNCHSNWNTFIVPTYKETINGTQMNVYEWMLQYARNISTNQPPSVNAGADKTITLPTTSTTLTATASDVDGTIASYSWTKISGGSAIIASSTSASTSITGLAQGAYTFRCTVTDNLGATGSDDVNVQVNSASQPDKNVQVNLYGNSNPSNLSDWDDWDITASLSKSNVKFIDGTASAFDLTLSAQTAYFDNGSSYTGFTMCPNIIGRYGSQYTGARTLTISDLDNSKRYTVSIIASVASITSSTAFTINGSVVTVPVGNNKSTSATFGNITPASGTIVVNIANSGGATNNYINAVKITESTPSGSRVATPGETPAVVKISPNPAQNQVTVITAQNNIRWIRIFDVQGKMRKQQRYSNVNSASLNVSDLFNGIYFVEIQQGSQNSRHILNIKR